MSGSLGKWLAVAVVVLTGGSACTAGELGTCESDADCDDGAVCRQTFCVREVPPKLLVTADRRDARLGEEVTVDAGASSAGDGSALSIAFAIEPQDAATLTIDSSGTRATVRLRKAHTPVTVVVTGTSASGATAEERVTIAPLNSPPEVALHASPEPFQPGDWITLEAPAVDVDGDALEWEWSFSGTVGSLEPKGNRAVLATHAGIDDVAYPVSVTVRDGRGGERTASVSLQPENRAPSITIEPGSVDHRCEGFPSVCSATFDLDPEADDEGTITWAYRLLGDRPDIAHSFEKRGLASGMRLELTCSPACAIAGKYTVEVTATDSLGASSSRQVELEVRNRPPVVTAHDGSPIPHSTFTDTQGTRYLLVRQAGRVTTWMDPDGDPPLPDSIEWSGSSSALKFDQPESLDTVVLASGGHEELVDLEVSLKATDINGAEAADRSAFPADNGAPSISYGGDPRQGHSYIRSDSDGSRVYRKEISLDGVEVSDPEGDPISIDLELDPSDDAATERGVKLIHENGRYFLEGRGPEFMDRTYRVIAWASDPWGGRSDSIGDVLVSNRPPIVIGGPGLSNPIATGRACVTQSCCVPNPGGGGCMFNPTARIATSWGGTSGPIERTELVFVSDPDGDPLDIEVDFGNRDQIVPLVRSGTSWVGGVATLGCTPEGTAWACPVEVRLQGMAQHYEFSCALPAGTNLGASVQVGARAVDGLGGVSSEKRWNYSTADDPNDGSCP